MIVPPLPCPVRSRRSSSYRTWGLLQTARPGEFERFGADDGGELRRQRPSGAGRSRVLARPREQIGFAACDPGPS